MEYGSNFICFNMRYNNLGYLPFEDPNTANLYKKILSG